MYLSLFIFFCLLFLLCQECNILNRDAVYESAVYNEKKKKKKKKKMMMIRS